MFAHATGFSWDEAILVLAPIAVVAAVLFLANNRAKHLLDDPGASSADGPEVDEIDDEIDDEGDDAGGGSGGA